MQTILASSSPRRKQLLSKIIPHFQVVPSKIDESKLQKKIKEPKKLVKALALAKAKEVKNRLNLKGSFLIIGADQAISINSKILGKPKSRKEAEQMLNLLKAKTHQVNTGVALISNNQEKVFSQITKVTFKNFTQPQLEKYLNTGKYKDKAGSYGIQDKECTLVKNWQGSYSNIVGLPIKRLKRFL